MSNAEGYESWGSGDQGHQGAGIRAAGDQGVNNEYRIGHNSRRTRFESEETVLAGVNLE
jgi:hypothetical protein